MAKIIKIVSVGREGGHEALVTDEWHGVAVYPEPATVCGIQLLGEDDVMESAEKNGRVTCVVCRAIIAEIQGIKNWK